MFPRVFQSSQALLAVLFALGSPSLVVGCSLVLDMPAPALCRDGACSDASVAFLDHDASTQSVEAAAPHGDATTGPDADGGAPPREDAGPSPFRCGGGSSGADAAECTLPQQCCMRTVGDAHQYGCTPPVGCAVDAGDYPIACAGATDCTLGNVCCHFQTRTTCVAEHEPDGGPGHCDNAHGGDIVCDPLEPTKSCPSGFCKWQLGADWAYYGCWPLPPP